MTALEAKGEIERTWVGTIFHCLAIAYLMGYSMLAGIWLLVDPDEAPVALGKSDAFNHIRLGIMFLLGLLLLWGIIKPLPNKWRLGVGITLVFSLVLDLAVIAYNLIVYEGYFGGTTGLTIVAGIMGFGHFMGYAKWTANYLLPFHGKRARTHGNEQTSQYP